MKRFRNHAIKNRRSKRSCMEGFEDLMSGNAGFVAGFEPGRLPPTPVKQLAVLTCMDCRIDVFAALGLEVGDAKVVRNAGAQLSQGAAHDLVLASHLLDVHRILIMPHTRCAMASGDAAALHDRVHSTSGHRLSEVTPRAIEDQRAKLVDDVNALAGHPDLRPGTAVLGAVYDVDTGRLLPVHAA